jgi:hypothetical protein
MSVSSLFSSASSSPDPLSALYAPSTTAAPTSGTSSSSTSPLTSAASSASVSGSASLLAQLQQLSFSNPAAFKTATADIATQLQADAQQTGGSQGQALSSLAAKFQQASQTGDLSPLHSAHAHHGGHHHHGGGSTASAAAYQDNSDPFGAGSAAAGSSVQSQVSDIISQALTQDTGTPAAIGA